MELRAILRRYRNTRVLLAEVTGFDLERRQVLLDGLPDGNGERAVEYDMLVVAAGSHYSYFGHDEWERHAPELNSPEGALDIRSRVLISAALAGPGSDWIRLGRDGIPPPRPPRDTAHPRRRVDPAALRLRPDQIHRAFPRRPRPRRSN
jgi:hypothetical protein